MTQLLEGVVQDCVDIYGLKVIDKTRQFFLDYLTRYQTEHPEFNLNAQYSKQESLIINRTEIRYPYRDSLVDKLFMYALLTGKMHIQRKNDKKPWYIKSSADLFVLSLPEFKREKKGVPPNERRLFRLYSNITAASQKYLFTEFRIPNWSSLIEEVGQEPEVVDYLGIKVTSGTIRKTPKP